jgi:acyl carrier protein
MDIENKIRGFIVENFLFGDASLAPAKDASLLEGGVIDSTGVLELVFFIEEQFGVKLADSEIVPANLDSIARIIAFLETKKAAA